MDQNIYTSIHDVISKILKSDAIISLLELQATSVVMKQKKKSSNDSEFQNFKKQSASHIISSLILYYNSNLPSQLNPLWTELISLPTNNALSNGQSTNQNSETVNRLGLLLQTGSSVLRVEPLRTVFKCVGMVDLRIYSYKNPKSSNVPKNLLS